MNQSFFEALVRQYLQIVSSFPECCINFIVVSQTFRKFLLITESIRYIKSNMYKNKNIVRTKGSICEVRK